MAVLLAGVGNLRNVMATVAGLKQSFGRSVHFVLNDKDPQVLARNVFFLYTLWKYKGEEEKVAQQLTQIWYSVKIGEEEAAMAQEFLSDEVSLLTGEKTAQTTPREQLRLIYELAKEGVGLYLRGIPPRHRASAEDWFKTGLLLPKSDPRRKRARRDNATLAAWNPAHDEVLRYHPSLTPMPAITKKVGKIAAGINSDAMPFSEWDYLEVKAQSSGDDLLEMYSQYISDVVKKFACRFNQGSVSCHVILDDCLNLQAHLPVEIQFDRVFTSNISDYINYPGLLETLRPLLRKENKKSVIITEFMNWVRRFPEEATPPQLDGQLAMSLFKQAINDLRHEPDGPDWVSRQAGMISGQCSIMAMMPVFLSVGVSPVAEYFDNWGVFNQYLRAALLAHRCPESSHPALSTKDVPKMYEVRNIVLLTKQQQQHSHNQLFNTSDLGLDEEVKQLRQTCRQLREKNHELNEENLRLRDELRDMRRKRERAQSERSGYRLGDSWGSGAGDKSELQEKMERYKQERQAARDEVNALNSELTKVKAQLSVYTANTPRILDQSVGISSPKIHSTPTNVLPSRFDPSPLIGSKLNGSVEDHHHSRRSFERKTPPSAYNGWDGKAASFSLLSWEQPFCACSGSLSQSVSLLWTCLPKLGRFRSFSAACWVLEQM
uniref:DUF4470 domain-containing protein n=1 Tax=Branchiostoma floridae TaxID=7739 RepID=C3YH58_BRAFL|eukprot:XP_002604283.1 hypothetical protein BRAFLDRAFT_88572 [Branchiostoma floridae]